MKTKLIFLILIAAFYASCKKDLGNYDYSPPSEPTLSAFKDSTFAALLGDSLILKPSVGLAGADIQSTLSF